MIDKAEVSPRIEITENPQEEHPVANIPRIVPPPKTMEIFPPSFLRPFMIFIVAKILRPTRIDIKTSA